MNTPLVSVIIPTYNRGDVICDAIDSVLTQSYSNIEVVVVDDGSMDDTQSRLRRFGKRIRIVTQDNAGTAAARNRGIEESHGKIIAFQDSDDLWKPTKLERQVGVLEKLDSTIPCCLCNAVLRLATGEETTSFEGADLATVYEEGIWLNVAEVLATRFVLFNQTIVIRREALERVGMFDRDLKYLEDYDLSLRLALDGPWAFVREPLVIYNQGSANSLTGQTFHQQIALKERELRIFGRALEHIQECDKNGRVRRQLERRIRIFRRGLVAANLRQSGSFVVRATGRILNRLDHYGYAAFGRSPWFPKMVTAPISSYRGATTQ
jgi:glycosyltransferase involved in cell wall biosynthesis